MIFIGLQVVSVLFLFNYAADLSLGWARREERKRGERQNERERERREKSGRAKEREKERERARDSDRQMDRPTERDAEQREMGRRPGGGALPSACCMGVMRRRGVGVNEHNVVTGARWCVTRDERACV